MTLRISPSYIPSQLLRILGQRKDKQSLAQYIKYEEINDDKGDNVKTNPKSSMFDRLQPSILQQRPYVFSWIKTNKTSKSSMFLNPKVDKHLKSSIFTRIKKCEKSSSSQPSQERDLVFSRSSEMNEIQNFIPSCMQTYLYIGREDKWLS